MKKPPPGPEFERFTDALRKVMRVSKTELQRRMEEEKKERRTKRRASPGSGASPTSAS
jgi:hypothetical protein